MFYFLPDSGPENPKAADRNAKALADVTKVGLFCFYEHMKEQAIGIA